MSPDWIGLVLLLGGLGMLAIAELTEVGVYHMVSLGFFVGFAFNYPQPWVFVVVGGLGLYQIYRAFVPRNAGF